MRKICLLLCCVLLTVFMCACAEAESIKLTSFSPEELLLLKEQIDVELTTRGVGDMKILPAGTYVVGKDIAEGQYSIHFIPGSICGLEICVYKEGTSSDAYDSDNYAFPRIWINNTQGDGSLSLTAGQIVVVTHIGDGVAVIEKSTGLFMD